MATLNKRKYRTRSSKKHCEEKFCCLTEGAVAFYFCIQCKTNQCQNCESEIHKSKLKFDFHDRQSIDSPPYEDLCQIASLLNNLECEDSNFADLHCDNCERNFCRYCFDVYHNKDSRKTHRKYSVKEYRQRQAEAAAIKACSLKPLSPVSQFDDSLTFLSCPQISDSLEDSGMMYNSVHSDISQNSIPDLLTDSNKQDMHSLTKALEESQIDEQYADCDSFLLVDEQETLQVIDNEDFTNKLKCDKDSLVKVVSIFGNTGDGKSHTLNHTFFGGKEVFKTSAHQASCTVGVWASYDQENSAIVVDTEGLLGVTTNQNQRTRLLLKLLAVSDVVIYRTRAERLHNDMFFFLGDASKAYSKHFTEELRAVSKRNKMSLDIVNMSPSVVIFHETQNTNVLGKAGEGAETTLRERFKELECTMNFSDLKYVGTKTARDQLTDFSKLRRAVQEQLHNNTIRAPRKPEIVFKTFQVLNDKFSGEIEKHVYETFPDQYFTCGAKCQSCGARCVRSMNHNLAEEDHITDKGTKCKYQHQFENKVYYCRKCYRDGKPVRVVPKTSSSKDSAWVGVAKYVWAGDILECRNCGIIYRSRQFWYGNPEVESVIHEEVAHVWPEGEKFHIGTHNAAWKVIDGLSYVAGSIGSVSAVPTKVVSDWVADQIAPSYWVPNSKIKKCYKCEARLLDEQKHHCRSCGQGFCDMCSSKKRPVPDRGWTMPVRVCDSCFHVNMTDSNSSTGSDTQVTARKVGESLTSAIDIVSTAISYPLGMLKDSARPAYWVPDDQITKCCVCAETFSLKLPIHHCRACGQGVCSGCSPSQRPVPLRGWDYPVRVCKNCEKKKDKI
ncbi:zinc finger FYVE domain-containing protein 1-like [Dreissena polymorpha]|uniref:FYVE-type domain-containing protein n=1 Tax=Dreissena polymorpha TaxID=45954 RepID=A0A9D4L3V6_DREPO|nr:zinc finger FYVE domain-containing protein 1-like [Dreissena polymorpha]XP_052274965.1 zinc finger FYVE domain-containing protein 1-like [Dreissena polymorpha]XP_052274967.1 zinc finger FYVE domain-containing protein 1-like [Dreissena polymorpha]XP_052274968.1 zinc finger FYVE domain-containing protein 1-like [Dreissena polymorpha]XP_052274969.1 zinc finger FYVE domain-containing protein 1-like [Dreissena polymorpha]XP_052274970.1 zinc finger FYVE domain-containing protein 1-like [Dreissena